MYQKNLFTLLLMCLASSLFALDASVTYSTFKTQNSNYVELQFHIVGSTVMFEPIDSMQGQAFVDVMILFKKGEAIVKYDKFRLTSPVSAYPVDFIDLKRYALENGKYKLEVSFEDIKQPENKVTYDADVSIFYSNEKLQMSSIQLLNTFKKAEKEEKNVFVKHGYYLEGTPFNFYDKRAEQLNFYAEIYNSDKAIGEDFMISYAIHQLTGNDKKELVLKGHKRQSPQPINVILQQVDILDIPSGNYELTIEVRNRLKALLTKESVFFQRSNPYLNVSQEQIAENVDVEEEFVANLTGEELEYSLRALAPIVSDYDGELINRLIAEKKLEAMRLYLYSYWASLNGNNPKMPYDNYMKVAKAVDRTYDDGFRHGFESDRGHIFMKYGKPNDVVKVEDEPSAPPYEIWTYYQLDRTNQRNVKFLFYNPSLATGQFLLLHSTARGEVNNPRWEVELYRNAPMEQVGRSIESTQMVRNFDRRARELMGDF